MPKKQLPSGNQASTKEVVPEQIIVRPRLPRLLVATQIVLPGSNSKDTRIISSACYGATLHSICRFLH